ncbi:MAG: DsbA family protein [Alphaproteobacteria bacterium]|nr:DsbA family protein [Alphaproteobacteria bacterium]
MRRLGLTAGLAAFLLLAPAHAADPAPAPEPAPAPAAGDQAAPPAPPALTAEEKAAAAPGVLAIKSSDIGIGDPNAKVKIVEYASSGCPHCAHFALNELPQLKTAYLDTGKAYFVLRDFPLDNVAAGASLIARCLPPEKFYPFMDTLFQQQNVWHSPETKDPEAELKKLAAAAGMDEAAVDACWKNDANFTVLKATMDEANRVLDVNSTPTLFIDGVKAEGDHSFFALAEKINAELAK